MLSHYPLSIQELFSQQTIFCSILLDQLNQVSAVNVDNDAFNYVADDDTNYQLMYKDEEYFSDYDLDHLSDEYLDYLYQIYDDMSNALSLYDDIADDVVDDSAPVINILEENNNDFGEAFSRSKQAEGRSLDPEEEITEQLVDNIVAPIAEEVTADIVNNKLEYVDKFLNASKEEVKEETTETTIEDFVVELKSTNNSDVYIKIAIFITVTLAVLIMTGGLIFVLMKRKKIKTVSETSLVTHQEDSVNANQVVFQKGLKTSTTTSLQEHFSNHFGKAAYLYDDLHSLDNDSFLTSLETISEKDKFGTSLTGIEKSFDTFLCRFGPGSHGFVLKTTLGWEPRGPKLEHYAADKMRGILPEIGWLLPVLCQSA